MTDTTPPDILDCERERLANSGSIQSYGVLIFLDRRTGQFRCVSANSESLLGETPETLLGQDGHAWLEQYLPELEGLPSGAGKRAILAGALDMGFGPLDVLISPNSAGWLLEFEPAVAAASDPAGYRLDPVVPPIDAARLARLQQNLVDVIAAVTGYDRVMLYRFDPDWSGEVVAESVRHSPLTYNGLRFPASDIPAIARGLYAQTPYRHIPDIAAPAVPLLDTGGDATQLDLTWSDLRSVSPVHIEYLHNMQVGSSFSVSVILDGKLWGLIACHHPQPLAIALQGRQRCRELAGDFAEALQGYRKGAQRTLYETLARSLAPVQAAVAQGLSLPEALGQQFPALASLFGAASGALFVDEHLTVLGEPRDPDALQTLHHWCLRHQGETVFALDRLPESLAPELAARDPGICGLLAIGMRAGSMGNALVSLYLLRPEEIGEIAWAGNPEKALAATPDGLRLSPRQSFEKWVEVRHGYSRPWDEDSLFAAQQLRERCLAWL